MKITVFISKCLEKLRALLLNLGENLHRVFAFSYVREDMRVIFDSTNQNIWAITVARQSRQICVCTITY